MTGLIGPFAGNLSTRIGRRPVLVTGLLILVLGLLITLTKSIWFVIAGCIVLGFGMFAAHSAANAYVSDQAHSGHGAASGFYLFSYYVGGSVGVQVVGWLWTRDGWPAVVGTSAVAALVAALIAATVCRDTPHVELPAPEGLV